MTPLNQSLKRQVKFDKEKKRGELVVVGGGVIIWDESSSLGDCMEANAFSYR